MTHVIPPHYPLNFYDHSILPTPLYHYRSDWEAPPPGGFDPDFSDIEVNFRVAGGSAEAQIGDRVGGWYNAYSGGYAFVPDRCPTEFQFTPTTPPTMQLPCNGGNWWGEKGYPTLVSRIYNDEEYKGLKFTGTEFLQINGRVLKYNYGITDPLFTTGGSETMTGSYKNSGASFLFVVDPDPAIPGTLEEQQGGPQGAFPGIPQDPTHPDTLYSSNWEVMLYSRQPGMQGAPRGAPNGHLEEQDPIVCGSCGCPTPLCPPICDYLSWWIDPAWCPPPAPGYDYGCPVFDTGTSLSHKPFTSTSMMYWDPFAEGENPDELCIACWDRGFGGYARLGWHELHRDVYYTWPETEANGVQLARHYRNRYDAFGGPNFYEADGCNGRHHFLTWGPTGYKTQALNIAYSPLMDSRPWGYIANAHDYSFWTMGEYSELCDPPCYEGPGPWPNPTGVPLPPQPGEGHLAFGTVTGGTMWSHYFNKAWHSDAPNPKKCDSTIYSGPQVILLEYDNTDHIDWKCGMPPVTMMGGIPLDSCCELNSLGNSVHTLVRTAQDYIGPRVKVYGLGNNLPPTDRPNTDCAYPGWQTGALVGPRWGSDLSVATIVTDVPAVADHVLFDDKNIFLGGIPPVRDSTLADPINWSLLDWFEAAGRYDSNKFGNGMRGVLYEFMMFEGKLSHADKVQLGDILKAKYSFLQ